MVFSCYIENIFWLIVAIKSNKWALLCGTQNPDFHTCISACSANCLMAWQHNTFTSLNSLRPRQNRPHFADDIFMCIFLNENVWISIKISLKFVPKGPINNIPALIQIMAWRRSGDKSLSEPMVVRLPTHICVSRSQWVNMLNCFKYYRRYIHILLDLSRWN